MTLRAISTPTKRSIRVAGALAIFAMFPMVHGSENEAPCLTPTSRAALLVSQTSPDSSIAPEKPWPKDMVWIPGRHVGQRLARADRKAKNNQVIPPPPARTPPSNQSKSLFLF
jgi:hypothetical protein